MDLPWEGLFILLKKNPPYLFLVPLWLTSGPARLTHIDVFLVDCEGADWMEFEQLDLQRYRSGMIKIEVGALTEAEIGRVVDKLKTAGYQVGFQAEDIWAFA